MFITVLSHKFQINYPVNTDLYWSWVVFQPLIDITASSVARLSFRKDPKNISNSFWKYLIFKILV